MTRLSEDLLRQAAALYSEHKSERKAAAAAGLSKTAFRHRLTAAAKAGLLGFKPVLPGFEIKQTSANLDAGGRLKEQWIQQRPESGEIFAVPDGHRVRGVSALLDQDDRVRIKWVKTWHDRPGAADIVAAARAAFVRHKPARPIAPPRRAERDYLTVYPIADQHIGLLSWGRETGENYDLAIGARRLRDTARELVARSRPSREAIILNLGDWTHSDDQRNMTPRSGHLLDVDGRYFKVLTVAVALMIDVIELAARRHRIVTVRNLPGNHDPHASIALTIALAAHYRNNRRIVIDQCPSDFFFRRFGQVLIGAHHGHKMKPERFAMLMADIRREDWGRTRFHHAMFGHIHHETAREVGSCRIESFQTLAAKDAHLASSGYSAGQSLTAITFHRDTGEHARHRVNIVPPVARS